MEMSYVVRPLMLCIFWPVIRNPFIGFLNYASAVSKFVSYLYHGPGFVFSASHSST